MLVIEDNDNLRKLIGKSLEKDFEVCLCSNAEEAYDYLEKELFFLIVLDLNLPGMSGYEFISEIKSRSQIQNPFIIMISANNSVNTKLTAINLGAVSFIEKPFDIRYLRGVVRNFSEHIIEGSIKNESFGDLTVDLNLNQIKTLEGENVVLTESEKNILRELIKNRDKSVARERLFLVSGHHQSDTGLRVIDSHISSLRKKIKNTELEIKSVYGKGYKIKKVA